VELFWHKKILIQLQTKTKCCRYKKGQKSEWFSHGTQRRTPLYSLTSAVDSFWLFKKFPLAIKVEGLPLSYQKPTTGPYPEL
jgi:hypothetical protein